MSRWIRTLLPSALLIVTTVPFPAGTSADVITLDVDEIADAGPLSLAAALARSSSD